MASWATVETNASPKGLAKVKVSKTGKKVKIIFEDGSVEKTFSVDMLPSTPKNLKTGMYFAVLSSDRTEVISIRPERGLFKVRCVDFVRPEDGADPIPKTYNNKKYGYSYQAFTAMLEIVEGQYKGVQIPYFLHYKVTDDGQGYAGIRGNPNDPKATRVQQFVEFVDITGISDEQIPWPEDGNILPEMLRICLKKKKQFDIVLKNGYIESILEASLNEKDVDEVFEDKDDDFDDDDEDEDDL